ncbi:hypothetical protein [Sphingobium cupriresistens]|uniref:Uncharacterized protein n=1 Tax=Sphingobium cupriresistens LL01 TaxID=1420583 RepID=A0A0J7XUG8_9SPHN|nr:hypothetical protein [Sphingobium cupriresistens]KMS54687.1 hypothetical protein V473_15120 [Sphingobium cupriresistens LL01]KMS54698.1 hypothetical protein V473_15195 [Sphingobium cupriresistens LL01]
MDLYDLRLGDYVIKEDQLDGRLIGEVLHIRARISYLNAGFQCRDWVDITTGTAYPYRIDASDKPTIYKASPEDIQMYGLEDRPRRTLPAINGGQP